MGNKPITVHVRVHVWVDDEDTKARIGRLKNTHPDIDGETPEKQAQLLIQAELENCQELSQLTSQFEVES